MEAEKTSRKKLLRGQRAKQSFWQFLKAGDLKFRVQSPPRKNSGKHPRPSAENLPPKG